MKLTPPLPKPPPEPHQLEMPLDAPKLRGFTANERHAVLGALASLVLEAASIVAREDDDERI